MARPTEALHPRVDDNGDEPPATALTQVCKHPHGLTQDQLSVQVFPASTPDPLIDSPRGTSKKTLRLRN